MKTTIHLLLMNIFQHFNCYDLTRCYTYIYFFSSFDATPSHQQPVVIAFVQNFRKSFIQRKTQKIFAHILNPIEINSGLKIKPWYIVHRVPYKPTENTNANKKLGNVACDSVFRARFSVNTIIYLYNVRKILH